MLERLVAMTIEMFFSVCVGYNLMNRRNLDVKTAVAMTVPLALFGFGLRLAYQKLGIPLGTHTYILLLVMVIMMKWATKSDWIKSVSSVLISFIFIFLGEGMFLFNYVRSKGITFEEFFSQPGNMLMAQMLTDRFLMVAFVVTLIGKHFYVKRSV